jgi:oxygen-independent coproporphyrinogen-3 oxidase
MAFSLYVHVPYCQAKCPYCDFNSHAAKSWPEDRYTSALIAEMQHRSSIATFNGDQIKTIFFGGGTPSLFAPSSIGRIIDAANQAFGIERDAEITLEANPGTVDAGKLAGFRHAGVTRISFGAQSFKPELLRFLGRIHSADETREAAVAAHRAGFDRLNLDLIFAVPGQTLDDVASDIAEAAALEPDHISAYNLTFEEGTAFFTDLKRNRIRPLSETTQAAMYALVREEIPRRGYPMYEISNYAEPGHEARHNLTYWRAESYLGLGAGAHSFARDGVGGHRWWNEKLPTRYVDQVATRGTAETGGEAIDARTAQSEFVFLNLRLRDGFDPRQFEARFGQHFHHVFGGIARRLADDGLLSMTCQRVSLTDRGLEMADSVFAEFL